MTVRDILALEPIPIQVQSGVAKKDKSVMVSLRVILPHLHLERVFQQNR
jgi:hypothetical protein